MFSGMPVSEFYVDQPLFKEIFMHKFLCIPKVLEYLE